MKNIVVIYHNNCEDGFSGAWAAYKILGDKADYIGVVHQEPPPTGLKNKIIYFIDFVYKEKVFKKIVKDNKAVIALDHHVSAKEDIKLADDYVYDVNHSGASIAWKYFHPKKTVPYLIKIVEDQDLWNFRVPYTREISEVLFLEGKFTFQYWDKLAKDLEKATTRKKYIEKGKLLLTYNDKEINELVSSNTSPVKFEGHEILAANAPHFFASRLGHALYTKKPHFSLTWCQMGNKIKVSLRSDGKVDVSELAKKYGGGGHKAAAGFAFPINMKFPWQSLRK